MSSSSSLGESCEFAMELKRKMQLILPAHNQPVTRTQSRGKKRSRPKNCPWACNCLPHMRSSTSGNPHHHQDCVKKRWLYAYNAGLDLPVPIEGMVIASISKRAQDSVPPMKYIGGSWVVLTAQALRTTAPAAAFFPTGRPSAAAAALWQARRRAGTTPKPRSSRADERWGGWGVGSAESADIG